MNDGKSRPEPVFIIGAPRSGTSVMNWAVGQHPNIQVMPETAWIATFITGAFVSYEKGSERGQFSHLSNVDYASDAFMGNVANCIDTIVKEVYEQRCQNLYDDYRTRGIKINPENPNAPFQVRRSPEDPKNRWIDGTPLNSHFAWAIAKVFPGAKFIHNLRNPADVALSLENFERVGAVSQALAEGLKTWMHHTEDAWLTEKALGPERVFRLEFDRIENDSETMIRELLEFLGEPYCEDCLLPLAKKTNSSEVDDERPALLKRIKGTRNYKKAMQLYDSLYESVSDEARREAEQMLKQRFEEHLAQRPLL